MAKRSKKDIKRHRQLLGGDLNAIARTTEGSVLFASDRRFSNSQCLTSQEKRALGKAEKAALEACKYWRVVGNRLENPPTHK